MLLNLMVSFSIFISPANLLEDNINQSIEDIRLTLEAKPSIDYTVEVLERLKKNFWTLSVQQALKNMPYDVSAWIPTLLVEVASARLALHQLVSFYIETGVHITEDQMSLFRSANRILRSIAEEAMYMVPVQSRDTFPVFVDDRLPMRAFIGGLSINKRYAESFLKTNEVYSESDYDLMKGLRSGDIFVVRGNSEISALIARMPKGPHADGQASHLFVAYQDPAGKWWTLEALIEDGFRARPFKFFEIKESRFTIYRMKDQELARLGAERLYQAIVNTNKSGHQIRYNFSLNPIPDSSIRPSMRIFEACCTQSSDLQVKLGSDNQKSVPMYPSWVEMKESWLLDMLKIKNGIYTFLPSDAELDPSFDFVLEKSNPELAHKSHLADAILSVLLASMEKGHIIIPDWRTKVVKNIFLPLRKAVEPLPDWLPLIGKFKRTLPWYIERDQLQIMVSLNTLYLRIQKKLLEREKFYVKEFGVPMSWKEMLNEVQMILKTDERVQYLFPNQNQK